MSSRWKEFGFDDVTFLSNSVPLTGIFLAIQEKYDVLDEITVLRSEVKDLWKAVSLLDNAGTGILSYVDSMISSICREFCDIRYEKNEMKIVPWSFESLVKALEAHPAFHGGLLNPNKILCPVLNPGWAWQRKTILDVLRHVILPFESQGYSGSVHTGEPLSPQQAFDGCVAVRDLINGSSISAVYESIYGPTHGWAEGTYCGNLGYSFPDDESFPVTGLKQTLYAFAKDPSDDGTVIYRDFGTGLQNNTMNVLDATSGNPFSLSEISYPANLQWPTLNNNVSCGFRTGCWLVADLAEKFKFYDGDPLE